jgi:hypothetical protein
LVVVVKMVTTEAAIMVAGEFGCAVASRVVRHKISDVYVDNDTRTNWLVFAIELDSDRLDLLRAVVLRTPSHVSSQEVGDIEEVIHIAVVTIEISVVVHIYETLVWVSVLVVVVIWEVVHLSGVSVPLVSIVLATQEIPCGWRFIFPI